MAWFQAAAAPPPTAIHPQHVVTHALPLGHARLQCCRHARALAAAVTVAAGAVCLLLLLLLLLLLKGAEDDDAGVAIVFFPCRGTRQERLIPRERSTHSKRVVQAGEVRQHAACAKE